jgi:hypothetical protein
MTSITIQPVPSDQGGIAYLATSNGKRSQGATAGEALDALTRQLPNSGTGALVIVPDQQPDQFFNADQQRRLAELLDRRRTCRDGGSELSTDEQKELQALVDAELRGAAARAAAMLDELKR